MAISQFPSRVDSESEDKVSSSAAGQNVIGGDDGLFNLADEVFDQCSQCENSELYPPLSSATKNNSQKDINDEQQKQNKRKIYRPKVVSEDPKRTKKSHPQSSATPKPSTPKPRKSYVKKTPKCRRPLFDDGGDFVSLPFLENFNDSPVDHGGFGNSTITNESAVEYNSLQSYQKINSLSCLSLVESRRVGGNFPLMCKRKRVRRQRMCLVKVLTPFAKGKRSSLSKKKRKCFENLHIEGSSISSRQMRLILNELNSLKKKDHQKINTLKQSGELVIYKQQSPRVDVLFDDDTLRVWNLLLAERGHEEKDEQKRIQWEKIRKYYQNLVQSFLDQMQDTQGDRRFLPWKGSILDSVVGVFLTQNVSDYLSSSAFMSLAAHFPIKSVSCEKDNNMVLLDPKFDIEMKDGKGEEMEVEKVNEYLKVDDRGTECNSANEYPKVDNRGAEYNSTNEYPSVDNRGTEYNSANDYPKVGKKQTPTTKKTKNQEEKEMLLEKKRQYWDTLRKYHSDKPRHDDHMDFVDWKAVKDAKAGEVAKAIEIRGQHRIIAGRVVELLKQLYSTTGNMDLEWLRYIPPLDAKEYLLSVRGLGLKSVECIRLLALQHIAFPVDVNVARIVVRLGWVPLQPLPEWMQIHDLEEFPDSNKIQQYLWPRLCTLDHRKLYELHYQLITFGKVFCTKKHPNCNACPMKQTCLHYRSSLASKRLALPFNPYSDMLNNPALTSVPNEIKECEPIIEMPASPEVETVELADFETKDDEEIYPDYNNKNNEYIEDDIEDMGIVDLCTQESSCLPKTVNNSFDGFDHDMNTSTAIVALHPYAANTPLPKMKEASRLKTKRIVYVLPDGHPLLREHGHAPRVHDDPSPYLLMEWLKAELESSGDSSTSDLQKEDNSQTVPGTLLIPCRTAMKGYFPLNGTYFQINEVFADFASMIKPINVPRSLLWSLTKQIAYFGTGTSAITRGMSAEKVREFFNEGYICVRAFDTKTGAPKPISSLLHLNTTARFEKERVEKEKKAVEKEKSESPNELLAANHDRNIMTYASIV
ncbi:DNA glycosylase/AP lyase ROS1-like [Vicia villosa]|uniref:DNA glycosylase/AP lyase ROS1-like n=1 Tax=Vicia villosa TaxID=3911 RepID=UPI00273BDF8E|nr:DNA glycosylase/AP lyase ROS1-like [Vicia villosa]